MSANVTSDQRFSVRRGLPCPICAGGTDLPQGQGQRCHGYLSSDGRYAHCARLEYAGDLTEERGGTYAHRLDGPCRCGTTHGEGWGGGGDHQFVNGNTHAQRPPRRFRDYREVGASHGYIYTDEAGVPLYQALRFPKPGGGKTFNQARALPGGEYEFGLGDVRRVLFGLPRLLATDPGAWVHLPEGEKDCQTLWQHGFAATTNAMGAKKWLSEYSEALRDRYVVLLLDNDDEGRKHSEIVGQSLDGIAREVRVLEFRDLPEKSDVSDWFDGEGSPNELPKLVESAPLWSAWMAERATPKNESFNNGRIPFLTAREFAAQTTPEVDWIIHGLVAPGAITKMDGPPKKAGKTTLITHGVAAVLDGVPFLGKPTKRGPVVILSEQGGTSLREALQRANLLDRTDLHLALYRDTAGIPWREVVDEVMTFVDRVGAVLVVVDTLPACSGVRGDDENSSGRAMEALEPLQIGADTHNVGVIVSFHDRKGGGEVGDSGRGSTAYAGAVDIIVHLTRPGGNFDPSIRKLEALSRFDATPDELYIQLTPTGYVALGDETAVVTAALEHALLKVLPPLEDEAKRIASIKDKDTGEVTALGLHDELAGIGVKVARSTLDNELKRWVDHGYAGRVGDGKRGSPARYWLVKVPPEGFFRTKPAATAEETTFAASDNSQKHSSDAHPPSEETINATGEARPPREMVSSDAPSPIGGRNHFDSDRKASSNGHVPDFVEAEWEEAAAV